MIKINIILAALLLCFNSFAKATSVNSDIDIIFPEMDVNNQPESLYKAIGFDVVMVDGNAVYTLSASVDFYETWRVFGEYSSEQYWELGIGKNFYTEVVALEVSTKFSDYGVSVGTFLMMPISEQIVLFTDLNYNWNNNTLLFETERLQSVYTPSDTIDIQIGALWSAHEYLGLSYSFNQIYETQGASLETEITLPQYNHKHNYKYSKGSINYHKLSLTTKIWKLAPYLSYSHFASSENVFEMGLSFKF